MGTLPTDQAFLAENEQKKQEALRLWRKQKELDFKLNAMHWAYLFVDRERPAQISHLTILEVMTIFASLQPANKKHPVYAHTYTRLSNAIYTAGFLYSQLVENLQYGGVGTLSRSPFASAVGTMFTPIFVLPILALSIANLAIATYNYFKTPKEERTRLQKLAVKSSISSTLLAVGIAVATVCLALAMSGAGIAIFALGCAFLTHQYLQGKKAKEIKKQEYQEMKASFDATTEELNTLIGDNKPISDALETAEAEYDKRKNELNYRKPCSDSELKGLLDSCTPQATETATSTPSQEPVVLTGRRRSDSLAAAGRHTFHAGQTIVGHAAPAHQDFTRETHP